MESIGRFFVGVRPDREARHRLAAVIADAGLDLPGRVVPPDNWHITMRFLGQTEEVQYERLLSRLEEAELGPGFDVVLKAMGAFPKPGRARVLWAGVAEGGDRLSQLAELVEEAAVAAGFSPEDRPFHAHLTLSRIQHPRSVTELLDAAPTSSVGWTVDELIVFESHLGKGGARYEIRERFPLS